jgi:hypothetical protein
MRGPAPNLTYVYYGDVDRTGHVHGCGSEEWRAALGDADVFLGALQAELPPDALLVVTADHGMVDIDPAAVVDVADNAALRVGVELLAGEGAAGTCTRVPARSGTCWRSGRRSSRTGSAC